MLFSRHMTAGALNISASSKRTDVAADINPDLRHSVRMVRRYSR